MASQFLRGVGLDLKGGIDRRRGRSVAVREKEYVTIDKVV